MLYLAVFVEHFLEIIERPVRKPEFPPPLICSAVVTFSSNPGTGR